MKSLVRKLTSLGLAATMAGTIGVAAYAANSTGTEEMPAKATLVKELQVPAGTTTPTETFMFTVTSEMADAPTIADKAIAYTAADMDADNDGKIMKTADLFAGVTWPHAGEYVYTVKETAGTYNMEHETLTYSQAEYKLTVFVANGATAGSLYIKEIASQKIKNDNGSAVTGQEKVDPNPNDDLTEGGVRFVNTYDKTNVTPDTDSEGFLNISKMVAGEYGDRSYPFEFAITLTGPARLAADAVAKYSIYNADGTKAGGGQMTYGSAQTFQLKHGQTLRFFEVAAGTKYTVTEKLSTSGVAKKDLYTASAVAKVGGTPVTVPTVAAATDLAVGEYVIDDKVETADDVDFTNTFDDDSVTPTGILIQNAPYLLLALAAIGGMALYVVKRRKN